MIVVVVGEAPEDCAGLCFDKKTRMSTMIMAKIIGRFPGKRFSRIDSAHYWSLSPEDRDYST